MTQVLQVQEVVLPDHTRRWVIIDVLEVGADGGPVAHEVTIRGESQNRSFATQAEARAEALSLSSDALIVMSALSIDTILKNK